jgi:hypothetical protein
MFGRSRTLPAVPSDTVIQGLVILMRFETIEARVTQLQREQTKTRQDEVFGGLSPVERAAYERKEGLIRCLQCQLSEGQGDQVPMGLDDSSDHRSNR